jgi:perosamine synthetase
MSDKQTFLVPMSSPDITEAEKHAVLDVMETRYLSMGPRYRAFEQAVEEFSGAKHAIAVNSGTAGLHLCVRAAGVSDGDLVLTTPFSFVASTTCILFERAVPVYVDVDPITGNIDPQLVAQAVTDLQAGGNKAACWLPRQGVLAGAKLKALLPVDVFGQPAEMDPIVSAAKTFGLTVIEDSCEAIGAAYHGVPAGLLGDMGIFAFYPNKQMTTAEGGVIVTNDGEKAEFMCALRNQGRSQNDNWLIHKHLGYNYRMHELSAALGLVQISRLEELLAKRQQVADWYARYLADMPEVQTPQVVPSTTRMSWFVYVVRLEAGLDRDQAIRDLASEGIPARPYFSALHLQPFVAERFGYHPGDFPITEDLSRRGIALPFSSVMTEDQVALVCEKLKKVLG